MKSRNKQNPLLAQYEAMYEAKYRKQLQITIQMCSDAATIAANDTLNMGAGRAPKFQQAFIDNFNQIIHMTVVEDKDDPEMIWTKAKVDERIKKIVGEENFVPWDERYKVEEEKR